MPMNAKIKLHWIGLIGLFGCQVLATQPSTSTKPFLPPGLEIKGKLINQIRFQDKLGKHVLVIALDSAGEFGEDGFKSQITAVQCLETSSVCKKEWKLRDFNSNQLESIGYDSKSLVAKDWDGDGRIDAMFWYYKTCDGMDPDTLKLMVYTQGKKLAVRGLVPKMAEDRSQFERILDPAFKAAPKAFEQVAIAKWDSLVQNQLNLWRTKVGE